MAEGATYQTTFSKGEARWLALSVGPRYVFTPARHLPGSPPF